MTASPERDHLEGGWRAVAGEMLAGARDAVLRFPVTAVALFLLALEANLLIAENGRLGGVAHDEYLLPLLAAAFASLAAGLSCEARNLDPWARHCGSVIVGLVGFGLVWLESTAYTLEWILLPALAGLVPVAAYLGRGTGAAMWLFAVRLAFAALLAGLALLLFAGGISAILASLTYLFGIDVPDRLYGHVWGVTGLFLAPLFGLGQVPRDLAAEPDTVAAGFMERGMRALGDFVAAPLLIVYAVILHVYALKIAVTGEVPQGQIGWLVLAFGFCVFGSLILVHPFLDAARAPTRLFLRLWPFMLPVPLALLFYGLFLRIDAYGVTPDRYLLCLFGLTAAVLLLFQFSRRTRGDIRYMTALPVFALILAGFGPQGALATSVRSQAERFLAIAEQAPAEGRRHDEALATLDFLSANDALARVAPADIDVRGTEDDAYRAIAEAWGLDPDRPRVAGGGFTLRYRQPAAIASGGFDLVVPNAGLHVGSAEPVSVPLPDGPLLEIRMEPDAVVVRSEETTARFALSDEQIRALARSRDADAMRVDVQDGERRISLAPAFLHGRLNPEPGLRSFTGTILLRAEDWQ